MTGTTPLELDLYVNGERRPANSGARYESRDPYRDEVWATAPDGDASDVDDAVAAARAALDGPWGATTGSDRARLLRRLADLIERDADRLADLESRDNGKLVREMAGQARVLVSWYHYFAGVAETMAGEVVPAGRNDFLVYTRHEPVGVVGAIVPWNSPLLLMTWKVAPALAAGCTLVVKPSDHTPVATLVFADLVQEAGFPPGVFNVVTGNGPAVGQALAGHPGVDKVAFTGSTGVGREVATAAARNLNGALLELGGKSAQVIFADADLDAATNGVIAGVFAATGQTCMAGSRVLVHRSVHDELVKRVVHRAETIKLGDPREADTEMGPVANRVQYEKVLGFLTSATADCATVACGGRPAGLGGLFVEPTVLTDTRPGMRVVDEEVFGPVVCVLPFDDEDDAVKLANETPFGLAGSVWTKDVHRAHRVAGRLKAGTVWINAYRAVAPGVPFGGYKISGIGRENGTDAVREYTETKAVWVELTGNTRDPFKLG
ncbi:aldehyde dehydrogenase [Kutzneria sp. CA-103260]|uniref:aldehyde dehydrogenase n=1 Tax=Kutzneria sp. CA-103260 TaxID=2802641 RepID=UPI001BA54877|nr:aldehyde dehydrogenase [Kutzneria sp. CA-103260]QUQ64711.1 aldehyde dehydrogenase [Kutzneria sp. CA-103260]